MLCEFWGEDLYKKTLGKPVAFEHIAKWATQLIKILKYCEKKGIFHGDLKPQNILINDHNIVKLIDFGISKEFSQSTYLREAGTVSKISGLTKNYMAPEYFRSVEEQSKGKKKENVVIINKID